MRVPHFRRKKTSLHGFLEDWWRDTFLQPSSVSDTSRTRKTKTLSTVTSTQDDSTSWSHQDQDSNTEEEDALDIQETDFQKEIRKRGNLSSSSQYMKNIHRKDFDGYALRDAIYTKWGCCYDLDFQKVETLGFRNVYLNVMPFKLGDKRFRHKTELDYLMHLQAIVEILEKYEQLDYVLVQMEDTKKRPRANTSPLVAVPLRLDLTEGELDAILQG